MYPGKNGDAFLIDASGSHILIDAGYASTFNEYIMPDLMHLSQAGGRLDLLICTHIDADHIGGVIEFISSNGTSGARSIVEVNEVWHNSLRSLPASHGPSGSASDRQVLEAIQRRGFLLPRGFEPAANPISAKQGSSLARLLKQHGYLWNSGDGTTCMTAKQVPHVLPSGAQILLIGPTVPRLEELRAWWIHEMRKLSYKGTAPLCELTEDAYEMLCASTGQSAQPVAKTISASSVRSLEEAFVADTSPTNGSSIAVIVRVGGKKALFLGDAWAADVVEQVKQHQSGTDPIMFDAVKVSHHGSLHNTNVELLALIDAPVYLISSDGSRHGHPDFEVLAEIVDRPASFERKIYFNYETPASTRLRAHVSRSGAKFSVDVVQNDWIHI
ncbi:AVAST type 1 anti-phage system MBL fold metallo-hydrolase Avs1a [Chromobacterium violaceum]|uniref:AVAST type 1 anti-phage system MBL fold metallo-hydrolase Avs1a n=1 Tax=Chromobacterium violaceum TaxID=536 RepID=UPI0018AF8770|nr:AVAST type 1 anti-phage system MBL fold metallo-hydrolase Avs1a [Chromobacterium violaceum]